MTALHPMSTPGYRPTTLEKAPQPVLRAQRQARFVTISRQAWAGGTTLAQRLVEHLNSLMTDQTRWTAYDQELIDKVAADHHVSGRMIQEVVDAAQGKWLEEFFGGLSSQEKEYPNEVKIYHRVAQTVRALAEQGRAVIVGRGGVYITHDMPDGLHVRLVAPRKHRIERAAEALKIPKNAGAEQVDQLDRQREAFYKRYWYWQGNIFAPETFTVTLNAAAMDDAQMIACLTSLIMPSGDSR